ncbi:hypothetical protein CAEBREN_07045 [Caenorhabditis brenneri]|uniref:Serpin domain-containing protein n=1 Tax=Caenorhabditis brenneri TaxID=135651 RepID=G0NTP5_CAEBE|nr:hypothetical protein CAEBREN_07045 [Caenorhabditis brenneri]
MCAELPTVLITIALNVLKKAGVHRSLVFSPISILLSLWKSNPADPIFQGVASLNQTFWSENKDFISANNELDTTRFHNLLSKLSDEFIHFEIPSFKLNSNISTTEVLGSRIDVNHKFRFEIPTQKLHSNVSSTEMCRNVQYKSPTVPLRQEPNPRFVLRVCETIPFCLELNRPFLFSVLNGNIPMLIGVFNGV